MATLRVRIIDEAIKEQLCLRAAGHGRSIEAEVHDILTEALKGPLPPPAEPHLYERIRARFAPLGGVDLELPPPEFVETPHLFDE
jgi:antitoxin FitA